MKEYNDYDEYLVHQASKLNTHYREIVAKDNEYEDTVYGRYKDRFNFEQATVLCLGARLGGEVRAFKRLGAIAIGIDLNPGVNNKDVLYGDFHEIQFRPKSFEFVFCNCIDHVFDLDLFLSEARSVLRPTGKLLLELAVQKPGEYETLDTSKPETIQNKISEYFTYNGEIHIDNGWTGKLLICRIR
jgi:SAM-dependent methyltransferase